MNRLHAWAIDQPALKVFTVCVRVLLALAFAPSGFVKIIGEPFTTLPVSDPVGYFFAGFFSAHGYYRFVGVAQWAAGILLLFPRTATFGACLYLPIVVNIFAITVGIGPAFAYTRYVAGMMLLGAIYLLCWDWDRWRGIFVNARLSIARHGDVTTTWGLLFAAALAFAGVTEAHLARLRHGNLAAPLAVLAAGVVIGIVMLVVAFRRARSRV